jgi:uncharacterized membrane protein
MITLLGRIGFCCVLLLCFVGSASAVTRLMRTVEYLGDPAGYVMPDSPPNADGFEARYFALPYLSIVHAVAGLVFMILGPIQFLPAVRNRWIRFHRWSGRTWMIAALVGVCTALIFVQRLPVFGDLSTNVAIVFASGVFIVALVQGYRTIRRREIAKHREWMIRCFAIGLGISTFRVLIPLLMMPPIGASFPEAWETVAWLGFVINIVAAEAWINLTRKQPLALPAQPPVRERTLRRQRELA